MYNSKIFEGSFLHANNSTADEKFNEWIKSNPNIEILSFQYQ